MVAAWRKSKIGSKHRATKHSSSDLVVATEIYKQLGGSKFVAMTGAKNLVGSPDGLSFRLPGGNFSKYNFVRITLSGSDLYDIEVGNIHKKAGVPEYKKGAEFNDVYHDQMIPILERETGLRFSM